MTILAAAAADSQVLARSTAANRSTAESWHQYEHHRRRGTDLVLRLVPRPGALVCLLGAGNCNDIDLRRLGANAGAVHLVDIDEEAMLAGVARQSPVGTELTMRVADLNAGLDTSPMFDVVASAAILSQLVDGARDAPIDARRAHLGLMLDLLRLGGWGILISDLVSSATLPALATVTAVDLSDVMVDAIANSNFFTGTNPFAVCADLAADARAAEVVLHEPWVWTMSEHTHRLTYAVTFRRTCVLAAPRGGAGPTPR